MNICIKSYLSIAFICFALLKTKGQDLPLKISDQPDGLTLGYFNEDTDTCLPRIFIGNELQILFPCYNKDKSKQRVAITSATNEIAQLRKIITKEFIVKLNQCCLKKNCPDTSHGYFLMLKKELQVDIQYLDIGFLASNKCGSPELNELIALMNKINKMDHP